MKKMLLILTLITLSTVTLMAQTSTPPSNYGTADGSSGQPYFITTLDNLYWLSQASAEWDKHYIQTADIVAGGPTGTSTWDGGEGFSPIGNSSTYFTGSYNGQDHTIDGLYINRDDSEQGLFGSTEGATVQNLGVTNVDITGRYSVGGLVGYSDLGSLIDNCYSTGTVYATNGSDCYVGGLVGENDENSLIDNCWSSASVSAYWDYVGGLVGRNYESTISNSYSTGDVSTVDCNKVGGLVGINERSSDINNCYSTGAVSGYEAVGGLVGYNDCPIENCYSTGAVSGASYYVGGLVGENFAPISNSYSTGAVSGDGEVGGLVGKNSSGGTISNCYSRGDVTRISSGIYTDVGAFCGENSGTIEYCYSTGSVFYDEATDPTDKGFVGQNYLTPTYTNNFWDSELSNQTTATGAYTNGKTTAEMKNVCTFTNDDTDGLSAPVWDFETNDDAAWDMDNTENINNGYPFLAWENGTDVALTVLVATEPTGNPRVVSTLEHLLWISENSGSWGDTFEQTADIDASSTSSWNCGEGFSPIGNSSINFTGNYNGQDHTIDGLYINRDNSYQGLFGNTDGATIQNLGVTNVDITGTFYVGGLVGQSNSSTVISNCYSTGTVSGLEGVGGLVGVMQDSQINNCYSTGTVSGYGDVGGLVGLNEDSEINNCYSRGDVTRISGSSSTDIGAFCGRNWATIEYCYSTGSVFYDGGSPPSDKGFVGISGGTPTYTNNFWDSEASNQTYDNSSWGLTATEKTTVEMKDVATFTLLSIGDLTAPVWDFKDNPNDDVANEDYWEMESGGVLKISATAAPMEAINEGYPYLEWQYTAPSVEYVIISGYVKYVNNNPIEGVEIEFSNSGLKATTDATGYYERYITKGWTGTATPSMTGHYFTPNNYTYSSIQTNAPNQDYIGTKDGVHISGYVRDGVNIGIEGVDVAFSNGGATVITNATGHYSTSVTNGWSGTSTATKDDWSFNPVSYTYPAVTTNLTDQDYVGTDLTLGVHDRLNSLPIEFTVFSAYPNPFNPSTTISYGLDTDSKVTIQIYDITGKLINTLLDGNQIQGWHSVIWNGTNQHNEQVPAGLYLNRITSDNEVKTTKLMFLK